MKTCRWNDRISILLSRREQKKKKKDKSSEDEAISEQCWLQDLLNITGAPLTCCCSAQQWLPVISPYGFGEVITTLRKNIPRANCQAWGQVTMGGSSHDKLHTGCFLTVILSDWMAQDVNCVFLIGTSSASDAHQRTLLTAVKFISSRQRDNSRSLHKWWEMSLWWRCVTMGTAGCYWQLGGAFHGIAQWILPSLISLKWDPNTPQANN